MDSVLTRAVESLKAKLGEGLYSCCLYGSAVRGNAVEGISDLNLLIVVKESSAAIHEMVAEALKDYPKIDPFLLSQRGFDRSVRAFATKFASIRRNYRVLHGADPLQEIKVDPSLERFLCEQAMRNLRLRLVYSFITRHQNKSYDKFVVRHITAVFVQFSEALRLEGHSPPTDFEARIPILASEFKIDAQVLRDLLALRRAPRRFSDADVMQWHGRLFPVIDAVLKWMEARWAR